MGAAASIAPPETAELASTARALDALPEASRASWAKIRHLPVEDQVETVLLKLVEEGYVHLTPEPDDDDDDFGGGEAPPPADGSPTVDRAAAEAAIALWLARDAADDAAAPSAAPRAVEIERWPAARVAARNEPGFRACNLGNHRQTARGKALRVDEYSRVLAATSMERWFGPLAHLCGARGVGAVGPVRLTRRQCAAPPDELAAELQAAWPALRDDATPAAGWFVRTADCSPKDAPHHGGAGPHHSLARALAATLRGSERVQKEIARRRFDAVRERFDALLRRDASRAAPDGAAKPPPGDARVDADDDDGACALFFVPFVPETRTTRELRCFVHEGRLTALTQYNWHSPAAAFCAMDDAALARVARACEAFHDRELAPAWAAAGGARSYVMDVEFVAAAGDGAAPGDGVVRLVELNCFGAEFAAASALFHWLRDRARLYRWRGGAPPPPICVRVLEADPDAEAAEAARVAELEREVREQLARIETIAENARRTLAEHAAERG